MPTQPKKPKVERPPNPLEQILARYPEQEVEAALPVIYFTAAAMPKEKIRPTLRRRIEQSIQILGVDQATNAQEVADAIASYCRLNQVNMTLLQEVASTYRQGHAAELLIHAGEGADAAGKLVSSDSIKSAPAQSEKGSIESARSSLKVTAKRGLKK